MSGKVFFKILGEAVLRAAVVMLTAALLIIGFLWPLLGLFFFDAEYVFLFNIFWAIFFFMVLDYTISETN